MRSAIALAAPLVAAVFTALAHAGEPGGDRLTITQKMYLERLKAELGLDDEQAAKVRALLVDEGKRTRDEIRNLLKEEQKAGFEKLEAESPGRKITRVISGDGPGGLGGMMQFSEAGDGGPMGLTVKELRKELGLSDEEAGRIEEIFKKYRKERKAAFDKAAEEMDFGEMTKAVAGAEELEKKILKQVEEAIDEGRRGKFRALVENKKEEGPVIQIFGGDGEELGEAGKQIEKALGQSLKGLGRSLRAKASSMLDGLPSLDEVCERAGFQGVEGEILREKVKAVLEADGDLKESVAQSRSRLDRELPGLKDEKALQEAMSSLRKERDARRARLAELRESLRALLSYEQEAKLVAMGVLD